MGFIPPAEYDASFTPSAIAAFRTRCREAAQSLRARGVPMSDLAAETVVITVPRSFLGFRRAPEYRRERRVTLQGWRLHEVQTLMGHSGDEWYQWKVAAALGSDGELYRVESHREERNGRPTSDDGTVTVGPLEDAQLPLFDVSDPSTFQREPPSGYEDRFPQRLSSALDALTA
ncbi:hypothetical protein NS234_18685 [Microbacterium oxydans]|uniref:hypothetical protein n=1 Tax=Microbacterium oxydans TaxID=82380 RepID=UPI00073485AB|nr:hypothetical protein [Microbacterium oxydans]KTR74594.1 hypothetical protein NS234_18685 [Microbacterium oxydans]